MPKTLQEIVQQIALHHAESIAREAVAAYRSHLESALFSDGAAPHAPAGKAKKAARAVVHTSAAVKVSAPKVKRGCPEPGCTNPSRGPRNGWRCDEHKAAYLASRGKDKPAAPAAAPAKKAAAPAKKRAAKSNKKQKAPAAAKAPRKNAAKKPAPAPAVETPAVETPAAA